MRAAEHVLKYLSGTYADGIFYGKNIEQPNKLWGWVDADFAADLDTRRSHTGYVLMLNSAEERCHGNLPSKRVFRSALLKRSGVPPVKLARRLFTCAAFCLTSDSSRMALQSCMKILGQ